MIGLWHVQIGNLDLIMYWKAASQWVSRSSSDTQSATGKFGPQRLVLRQDFANYFNYASYANNANYFNYANYHNYLIILIILNCRVDKHRQQTTTLSFHCLPGVC